MHPEADLDIEMLAGPDALGMLALAFFALPVRHEIAQMNRAPEVGHDHRPVARVLPLSRLFGDARRKFIQDRQHRPDYPVPKLAIADLARCVHSAAKAPAGLAALCVV